MAVDRYEYENGRKKGTPIRHVSEIKIPMLWNNGYNRAARYWQGPLQNSGYLQVAQYQQNVRCNPKVDRHVYVVNLLSINLKIYLSQSYPTFVSIDYQEWYIRTSFSQLLRYLQQALHSQMITTRYYPQQPIPGGPKLSTGHSTTHKQIYLTSCVVVVAKARAIDTA